MNATTVKAHQNGAAFDMDTRVQFGEFKLGDSVALRWKGNARSGVIRAFDDTKADVCAVVELIERPGKPVEFASVAPCELTPL